MKSLVEDDDAIYVQVKELLDLGTSGIIFRGCPGTSKTWYAKQIAYKLAAKTEHIYQCQFHPSYGYEDFVEGYKPDESAKAGFQVIDKIFLAACEEASKVGTYVVFIIDEINRGDPARVFGELLTYIEHGYRGDRFRKAYTGDEATVPKNLVVFGTMNQYDRGIAQLDLALTRRFDHIDLKPDTEKVEAFLGENGNFSGDRDPPRFQVVRGPPDAPADRRRHRPHLLQGCAAAGPASNRMAVPNAALLRVRPRTGVGEA